MERIVNLKEVCFVIPILKDHKKANQMSLGRKLTHSCCCVYNIDSLKKYQNVDCVDNDKQFILKCKKLLHTLSESSVIIPLYRKFCS